MTIDEGVKTISDWAEKTFEHTDRGIVIHLIREVVELARATALTDREIRTAFERALERPWKTYKPSMQSEESADCTILLFALAGHKGFSLNNAIIAKHVVNRVRTWGTPDAEGVTEHVETTHES